jgi:FdhE protein
VEGEGAQHRESLERLERIHEFQASLRQRIDPGPRIEPDSVREAWRDGLHLFAAAPPAIPSSLFRQALEGLCSLWPSGDPARAALDALLASRAETLTRGFLADRDACIRRLADANSLEPDILEAVLRTALTPFFERAAAPHRELIAAGAWRRGICPMCGSEPFMARLALENGRRLLACPLCSVEWPIDRLRCPFCDSGDEPHIRFFTVEGDPSHRVECCDLCRRYLKTVDDRVSGRTANLPVEDVVTAHLGALAVEQGYQ